jgi:CheY-like chemotaxis protein
MSYRLAENGVEAINEVRKQQFDVILMDINMPVMGGIEFLSEYRRQGGSTPVVAFTANAMDEDIKRYLGMGFSDVLTKPLAYEKLHACLKQYN